MVGKAWWGREGEGIGREGEEGRGAMRSRGVRWGKKKKVVRGEMADAIGGSDRMSRQRSRMVAQGGRGGCGLTIELVEE